MTKIHGTKAGITGAPAEIALSLKIIKIPLKTNK
jgi:hypothetical protein